MSLTASVLSKDFHVEVRSAGTLKFLTPSTYNHIVSSIYLFPYILALFAYPDLKATISNIGLWE